MNKQQKTAVENLIIIARYIQEEGIMSTEDEVLLAKSISHCEGLIGKSVPLNKPILLCENASSLRTDDFIEALNRRKNLD